MLYFKIYAGIGLFFAIIHLVTSLRNTLRKEELGDLLKIRFRKEIDEGEIQLIAHGEQTTLYSSDPGKRNEIEHAIQTFEQMHQRSVGLTDFVFSIVVFIIWPFFANSYIKLISAEISFLSRKLKS